MTKIVEGFKTQDEAEAFAGSLDMRARPIIYSMKFFDSEPNINACGGPRNEVKWITYWIVQADPEANQEAAWRSIQKVSWECYRFGWGLDHQDRSL